MNGLSDVTNDEIREILENIRKKTNEVIDDDTVRKWSREDIDRLLGATRREEDEETEDEAPEEEESIYVAEESFADVSDILPPVDEEETDSDDDVKIRPEDRIRALFSDEAPEKKSADFKAVIGSAKVKAFSLAEKLKEGSKKLLESFKTAEAAEEEERYTLDGEEEDFDEDEFDASEASEEEDDGDMKIADFSGKKENQTGETETAEEKTIYIEKPGIVIKKGEGSGEDLEAAPIIMSADDALANDEKAKIPTIEKMENDLHSKLRAAQESGQMVMPEFEEKAEENEPESIEEDAAEKELFEKRKKKIDSFTLFGEDGDPYGSDAEKERIGELFDTHDDRPQKRREVKTFDGLEYDQTKDARRVQRYLNSQKKKSFRKTAGLLALFVVSIFIGIASSSDTTVGGDRILTIFGNLIVIMIALVVSGQNILVSFEQLKQKKFNVNTMISVAAICCFAQTILMFVLYFFKRNAVSVFGCAGVGLLLLSEITNYVVNCRTADAMEVCSGDNKDKLYSIESISDDKDIVELGRNIRSKSPRLRYSCKTRFPAHLIEMCTSETSADKRSRLYFAAALLASVINFIVAWAVNKHFSVGFAAFTITLTMCIPAYGALLTQLPLRWANRKLNKSGAMISCQDAVNELYRTNAIILDSKDLFDQNACAMTGFKDFKNVRMDDAMLYAAAMVIRSGGPLTGVFDQMVVNRRDILPTVKSFSYEEKMGVSGWIYNQKVILGNKTMMNNHSIEVPVSVDEDKYLMHGHEVMYLAIANKLAAMIVVDYAPNQKIAGYLKKLRDSGVSVLVRNCDPNVTERMISSCYDMRLDNIKIINSSSGRVFKKYKSRPKVATRAVSVHDGSTYTFAQSLCTAAMLRHTFKVTDTLAAVGIAMGFLMVLVLGILDVVADLPVIFVLLMQAIIAGAFTGITRISCGR